MYMWSGWRKSLNPLGCSTYTTSLRIPLRNVLFTIILKSLMPRWQKLDADHLKCALHDHQPNWLQVTNGCKCLVKVNPFDLSVFQCDKPCLVRNIILIYVSLVLEYPFHSYDVRAIKQRLVSKHRSSDCYNSSYTAFIHASFFSASFRLLGSTWEI